jgi:hypothetical protein
MAQDTDQDTSTDWGLTDLHTMIVKTHKLRNIPIGKLMRVALLAAADGKFALRDHRGSKHNLTQDNRDAFEGLAVEAEQQSGHRWWDNPPWTEVLRRVFVDDHEFFSWLDNDASSTLPAVETPDSPNRAALVVPSGLKSQRIEAHGGSPQKTESTGGASSKKRWRGMLFQPYLEKLYPPKGELPQNVTTGDAFHKVTKAMKADKKADNDIPSDDTFAAYVGRAKPRRRKR